MTLTLCAFGLTGCWYHLQTGPLTDDQISNAGALKELRSRAAFELDCPEEQLEMRALSQVSGQGDEPASGEVGVSGCGQRAVYLAADGNWILNSKGGEPAEVPSE